MKIDPQIEKYRIHSGRWGTNPGDPQGAFLIPYKGGIELKVIASPAEEGIPWEHVSVSLNNRTPNWTEMCYIKALFWDDEETVMQLHPPKSTWINNYPYCLHLWRPLDEKIPLPPSITVGKKEFNINE